MVIAERIRRGLWRRLWPKEFAALRPMVPEQTMQVLTWAGKERQSWTKARFNTVNYQYANCRSEAEHSLETQKTRLAELAPVVDGLRADVEFLTELIAMMKTVSGGAGV